MGSLIHYNMTTEHKMSIESITKLKNSVSQLAGRRKSSVFNVEELGAVPRESSAARMSFSSATMMKSKVVGKFENTYKMDPDDAAQWFGPDGCQKLRMKEVQDMSKQVLQNALSGENYDAIKCRQLSIGLSDDIKRRVRKMRNFPQRHRVIVNVYIGERKENIELRVVSRGMTLKFDSWTDAQYETNDIFATAIIYI